MPLRRVVTCLDSVRVPLNAAERSDRPGPIPYWGANTVQGYVDEALIKEPVVLVGEDGAPFFERERPVAFFVDEPIWPNNHIHVLRPHANVHGPWLAYALNDVDYSLYVTGATRDKLTQSALMAMRLEFPPLEEQRAISAYLDVEAGGIDHLVNEQTALIETVRERRAAVVDHAVWFGLDNAELACTGVQPAPLAPAHWRRARNKEILAESADVSVGGSEELLSVSHLTGISPRSEKNVTMIEAESLDGYRIVQPGDLVINTMWAWMGALGVSNIHGIVSPAYAVYRPRPDAEFHPPFFNYLYRSTGYVAEMTRWSRGIWSSRLRIYPEVFLRLCTVVPPLDEQRRIAGYLDEQTAQIDTLIAEAESFIKLAKERRAALITGAVTGQLDIAGVSA
jgi:type I restriction enzyme, S subunit